MRKIFTLALFALAVFAVKAQNIQLHYDYGRDLYDNTLPNRPHLTSTIEMFRPDKWGNTFFFIDMDHTSKGVASSYWEIAREFKIGKSPFNAHVEYNGGNSNSFSYKNMYLGGLSYNFANKDFSKTFAIQTMYKYIQKADNPNSFQVTAIWNLNFKERLFTLCGFADFWKEKSPNGNYIFLTEPQFWLNLNKLKGVDDKFKLSIGGELELSNNFAGRNGFYAIPTTAIKWNFE